MALLVKKVVVTEVAVTTVKVEVTKANVLDAAGESIQCANAVTWLPDHLDIDIETGVIRNWSAPTSEQLQHSDNADDLLVDALEPSIEMTEKEWEVIIDGIKTNPATTPENWQVTYFNAILRQRIVLFDGLSEHEADAVIVRFGNPNDAKFYMGDCQKELMPTEQLEAADPVQPEVAETAPDDQQSKQVEIEPIKPVENHQIDAFDQGVALAESVLVPVEPEPVDVADESLRRRTPAQPRYRNPDDHDQTWTGRGKQPEWLRQQIANGKNLEDFLIGANPSPVAAQESEHPENIEGLPVVVVEHPSKDKWVANFLGETATSTQGLYESIKGVLKRCNMSGAYEIKKLKTIGEAEVFTIDDSRTANTETVYLSKGADGWIAKTPNNKNVTAAISITGELTALLSAVEGIDPANAVITETTDDDMRTRGKRRYSIKAAVCEQGASPEILGE